MANVFANVSLDMGNLDLNRLYRGATWSGFYDDVYESFNGITYRDGFEVDWYNGSSMVSMFGGLSMTYNASTGAITGGTVTGYIEAQYSGGSLYLLWGIEKMSVSASALYRSAVSGSTGDERSLITAALSGSDTFDLSSGSDVAFGYGGSDAMYGYGGNDWLVGGNGNDKLDSGTGSDRLDGGTGSDKLFGGSGNDTFLGGAGADQLTGGSGRDVLNGGADSSRDIFIFKTVSDSQPGSSSRDIIERFKHGVDDMDLRAIDARAGMSGDQAFSFSGQTARANSVWYKDTGPDVFVRADITGDKVADFEILLRGVQTLSGSDFLL